MRNAAVGFLVLVLSALVSPGHARACSLAGSPLHTIDQAMVGVDQTAPQLAQPKVVELENSDPGGACGNVCGPANRVMIANLATDDMTPVDQIGYRLTVVAGTAPGSTSWARGAILGRADGKLELYWFGEDDFDFTLQVIAIDVAGNESAPQNLRINDASGGCSVGRRRASGDFTPALVALAVAIAAARRPRRRR
jgi:hypothetical protein